MRASYLQTNVDFAYTPPTITSVIATDTTPDLNTNVAITALVTNTNSNSVYLGYRQSQHDKFIRTPMYDDGAHNDGAAGDNVYGTSLNINTLITHYYIYAENNDAGIFSPERAEHEFYVLKTNVVVPTQGQLVINEFLASNTIGEKNEYGNYADWIELYNSTSTSISLFGLYLTDDLGNHSKFGFPYGTTILPDSFLTVWADEEDATTLRP